MGGGEIKDHLLVTLPETSGMGDVERAVNEIKKKWPGLKVTFKAVTRGGQPPEPQIFRDKTILITLFTLPTRIEDCPNLKLIHLLSAGSDHLAGNPIYKSTEIPITSSSGVHGPQISEWVMMTTLVQSHHYNAIYEQQKRHMWGGWSRKGAVHDLVGQRVGILGYGSIGRQVARVFKNAGSEIIAFTATPKDTPEKRMDRGYIVPGTGDANGDFPTEWYSGLDKQSLHTFLKRDLDILVLSLPLTPETRHMLGEQEFEILSKRKALLANVSRGPIIDHPALIAALKKEQLRGANLDVTEPEPLPEDSELWDFPNVIISPHTSGSSASYTKRSFAILEMNLDRLTNGQPLVNVINRRRSS